MDIEALTGAATIALLGSALFALTGRAWIAAQRTFADRSPFAHRLVSEGAQRFRDEFDLLGRKQDVMLASAGVFTMLFILAWFSGSARLLAGAGIPLLAAIVIILLLAFVYAAIRLIGISLMRRRTGFSRAANIAVGQELQKISGNFNRVFHDVSCHRGIVDHVLVGQQGAYAIFVIARRRGKQNKMRLNKNVLTFAPGRYSITLDKYAVLTDQLARMLGKQLRHPLTVRPVLVVPGWELEEQSNETYLIVNEQNLVMLRGWKDRSEYLLNEDVESLHELLVQRCARLRKLNTPAVAGEQPDRVLR